MTSFDEMYDALVRRDPAYEGAFVAAIKTTRIFCRSTCTARKPKRENVTFYASPSEALRDGYRPCRICRPHEPLGAVPDDIRAVIDALEARPDTRLRDADLRAMGIGPARVRSWFKRHHAMTFQAYQRMMRINSAYHGLAKGDTVTRAALDSGYESLSGFSDAYRSLFGDSPGNGKALNVIHITHLTSPLGPMFACATDEGVCLLEWTDRRMLEREFVDLRKRLDAVILPGSHPHLDLLSTELAEYFGGARAAFTVPLHTPGTPFQQEVWTELRNIPCGKTVSYGELAARLGRPGSARAVARANGMNRVAVVIPCHRVIGSDGSLTGYAGGLPRKKWLLEHEAVQSVSQARLPFRTYSHA